MFKIKKLDLRNFDTSNVTNMCDMFDGLTVTTLDLSNFDTSNVTTMSAMFFYCSSLTSLDVSNFDTSSVINMSQMFEKCSSLITLDLSNFNTDKLTNIRAMFYQCTNLVTIYVGNNWNTPTINDINDGNYVFSSCSKLVGGNGTVYNSSYIDYTYARVDTAVYDTDGTLLSGNPGYFTLKA